MKKKTRRGGQGKKGNKRNKVFGLSLLGTNAAGLKSKTESLFYLVNKFSPSVVTIQESKCNKIGLIKIKGFQVYEKVRRNQKGGGL